MGVDEGDEEGKGEEGDDGEEPQAAGAPLFMYVRVEEDELRVAAAVVQLHLRDSLMV